jgi:hypothetical protein
MLIEISESDRLASNSALSGWRAGLAGVLQALPGGDGASKGHEVTALQIGFVGVGIHARRRRETRPFPRRHLNLDLFGDVPRDFVL